MNDTLAENLFSADSTGYISSGKKFERNKNNKKKVPHQKSH